MSIGVLARIFPGVVVLVSFVILVSVLALCLMMNALVLIPLNALVLSEVF